MPRPVLSRVVVGQASFFEYDNTLVRLRAPAFQNRYHLPPKDDAKVQTPSLAITDSYGFLPHLTDSYRILPIFTDSYRFSPHQIFAKTPYHPSLPHFFANIYA